MSMATRSRSTAAGLPGETAGAGDGNAAGNAAPPDDGIDDSGDLKGVDSADGGFSRVLRVLSAPDGRNDTWDATLRNRGIFCNVQAALDSIPKDQEGRTLILIGPGTFREKLLVDRHAVCLRGAGLARTIITFDDCANKKLSSGERMHTFNSYTVYIGASDFEAEDLCIENSAGSGRVAGQAIACYVDADRASFRRCRIRGRQDTLFCGPLPANPAPRGLNLIHPVKIAAAAGESGACRAFGQIGDAGTPFGATCDAARFAACGAGRVLVPSGLMRHYFRDCLIEGDIDFIFGSATALFERCEIRSLVGDIEIDGDIGATGWITAASTLPGQNHGFVFLDCALTAGRADELAEKRAKAQAKTHGNTYALACPEPSAEALAGAPPADISPSGAEPQGFGRAYRTSYRTTYRAYRAYGACRVYLGRPWRPGAKVAFLRCRLGPHIAAEGWDAWDAEHFGSGPVYAEYASTGPGAPRQETRRGSGTRVPWALSAADPTPAGYSPAEILAGDDGWAPFATQSST